MLDEDEPAETKIELTGEIWINPGAKNKEITIKGKWRLSNYEEEQDFEYSYFKEFDKTLGLPPVERPLFTIEKDYSMLLKGGLKTPPFSKEELKMANAPKIFGGVYRGWFEYNGQNLNEFSSLNFLPSVEDDSTTFSVEGNVLIFIWVGDGHNPIGIYIIDGSANIKIEETIDETSEMMKVGEMKIFKYYTKLKSADESVGRGQNEENEEATHKISIKIKKPIFKIETYTQQEADDLRKTLPQFA